jgi:predicted negative regulator of RcsB-dependent stress response
VTPYETDDEKVEAIKKWWKDNGISVATGLVIGLALVFGWRAWGNYRDSVGSQASAAFEQLATNADAGQAEAVAKQAELLHQDFGSTPYPALGDLIAAKVLYEKGDSPGAIAALQRVLADAPDPAMSRLAALRLARIQLSDGQTDAAASTLAAHDNGVDFAGDFAAVRGDIAVARGDAATARAEYEKAIAAGASMPQVIRLKLDNLPAAG